MRYRFVCLVLGVAAALSAIPAFAATVSLTPLSPVVNTGADRRFAATVTGATDTSVAWSVNGIAGGNSTIGTIDTTGTYRAPVVPPPGNIVNVRATSNADPTAFAATNVYVVWPPPSISSVSPATLPPGAFTITVYGTKFINGAVVKWNGSPLATSWISASQLTASGNATTTGPATVTVANPGPGSVSPGFAVNVVSTLIVTVSPANATLQPSQTMQFSATVANSANQSVIWDASAGTIDASGFFTAPMSAPVGGSVTITAVSAADGVTKGTAGVNIQDPLAITYGRFLEQSTFGPTPQLLAHVRQVGIPAFLDEQFAAPESPLPPMSTATRSSAIDAVFANQLGGSDQLRQRVVYALSEVLVVSMNKNTNGDMIVPWVQILSQNAFGNYRTLLGRLTLDASMGFYLDMVNSTKPGVSGGANENYAREVMQLFSIGLTRLNPDGSPMLDPNGKTIPTYSQADVQQLARAFTGWTYGNSSNPVVALYPRGSYYPGPMVPMPSYHDTTQKIVLGSVIPAGQTPKQDIDAALDILFNHPNVGPFVATRLIRALVTSNPSPQYVQRIADVFADDGQGARGNLQAVVRAILLDPEARNDNPPASFGRLRTPVQHTIAMSRALGIPLGAGSSSNYIFAGMGEDQLSAPSVFGHYSPMFRIPKTALFGPEFQIYTATESVNRANFLYSLWFGSGGTLHPALAPFAALAGNPVALTNAVDSTLLYGRMPASTRTAIQQSLPLMYDNNQRVLSALYLTVMSGDYLVQH